MTEFFKKMCFFCVLVGYSRGGERFVQGVDLHKIGSVAHCPCDGYLQFFRVKIVLRYNGAVVLRKKIGFRET